MTPDQIILKKPTVTLDRKPCRRARWVSLGVERIGERYAILSLETRLKRPDLIYTGSSSKGAFVAEYWAGDDSYLGGKRVEQGTHQTRIRIPELDGWTMRMAATGRYSIEILLERRES